MEKVLAVQVRTHNHTPRTDAKVETRVMVAACNPTSQEVETGAPGTTWLIRQKKNQKVLGSAERPSLSKYAGEQSSNLEETQHPL